MNHIEPKKLDIDAVLKSKAKNHYNKIPKVAINYLKRKVHQDELNHIIKIFIDLCFRNWIKCRCRLIHDDK